VWLVFALRLRATEYSDSGDDSQFLFFDEDVTEVEIKVLVPDFIVNGVDPSSGLINDIGGNSFDEERVDIRTDFLLSVDLLNSGLKFEKFCSLMKRVQNRHRTDFSESTSNQDMPLIVVMLVLLVLVTHHSVYLSLKDFFVHREIKSMRFA
jgi:hypothetical protein